MSGSGFYGYASNASNAFTFGNIDANSLKHQETQLKQQETIDMQAKQLAEQASKVIELDAMIQMKDNQLADQEETIKQLLTALEASQSKRGLAYSISSYFK